MHPPRHQLVHRLELPGARAVRHVVVEHHKRGLAAVRARHGGLEVLDVAHEAARGCHGDEFRCGVAC